MEMEELYRSWVSRLPQLIDGYIYDDNKNLYPTRFIFSKFTAIINRFLENKLEENEKILILSGIRGVGKTTLLTQIFSIEKFLNDGKDFLLQKLPSISERIYLDVGKLKLENISLNDFFKYYENIKEFNFEGLNKKIIILLDEIHYDDNWGLFLKNIFDRTKGNKNVLIVATGSSAIKLKMNPDLTRRTTLLEMYPLKFSEYLILKYKKYPIKDLSNELETIIFNSKNLGEAYKRLNVISKDVDKYFASLPENIENEYFLKGGFPFTMNVSNEIHSYEMVRNVISNIISKDIIALKKFKTQVLSKINDLIYLLANSDTISYEKLLSSLQIGDYRTLESLIESLIMSGMILKVKSYGKAYHSTRKTPKILFINPSIRAAVLDGYFNTEIEGKKIEDYFALVYSKDLKGHGMNDIFYDFSEGGADFILKSRDGRKIIIEMGFNKEDISQIKLTNKRVNADYSIVFGSKKIELVDNFILKTPLKYLLLI